MKFPPATHHLLKTHAGWTYDRVENGTVTWTTPTGHKYTYDSPLPPGFERLPKVGADPDLAPDPELDGEPERKQATTSADDDPPPF